MLKKIAATAFLMISVSAFAADDNERINNFLPDIAKSTLATFKNYTPIEFKIDYGLHDGAQAAREYTNYSETQNCKITVNPDFDIFKEEVNPFLSIGLSMPSIRNMIMMHEMAHCMDGEPAPNGIDPVAWREALADGFAISMLYQKYQVSIPKISKISLFRNTNENGGAHKMLEYVKNHVEHSDDKNINPMLVLEKIKEMRREVFGVPNQKASEPILALETKKETIVNQDTPKNTESEKSTSETALPKVIDPSLVLEKIKESRNDKVTFESQNNFKMKN